MSGFLRGCSSGNGVRFILRSIVSVQKHKLASGSKLFFSSSSQKAKPTEMKDESITCNKYVISLKDSISDFFIFIFKDKTDKCVPLLASHASLHLPLSHCNINYSTMTEWCTQELKLCGKTVTNWSTVSLITACQKKVMQKLTFTFSGSCSETNSRRRSTCTAEIYGFFMQFGCNPQRIINSFYKISNALPWDHAYPCFFYSKQKQKNTHE